MSAFLEKIKITPKTFLRLLTLALVLTVLSGLYLLYNDFMFWGFKFSSLLNTLLYICPVTVLYLYTINRGVKSNSTALYNIVYLLIILGVVISLIIDLVNRYAFGAIGIFNLLLSISLAVAIYYNFKGNESIVAVAISVCIMLVVELISLINLLQVISDLEFVDTVFYLAQIVGNILFGFSLLLNSAFDYSSYIYEKSPSKNKGNNNISESLRRLKDEYVTGKITEEEYKTKRLNIISKL